MTDTLAVVILVSYLIGTLVGLVVAEVIVVVWGDSLFAWMDKRFGA